MGIFRLILFPFAVLYDGITRFRNFLYDRDILKSVQFEANVVVIGNLAVGGTGKTPMVEYLIRQLKGQYKIAVLSRGYGRKTRGFRIADAGDTARTIGDEPLQMYQKFGKECLVCVGAERETSIPFILAEQPDTRIILLDDAFQYRIVRPTLSIVLTRYSKLFFDDFLMPFGRLRECRTRIANADIVVVTDCPGQLSGEAQKKVKEEIGKYTSAPVFFTRLDYAEPVPLYKDHTIGKDIIVVTGVAHPEGLVRQVQSTRNLVSHVQFRDHHNFTRQDFVNIVNTYRKYDGKDVSILITEKDAVKWKDLQFLEILSGLPVFVQPVEHQFLSGSDEFLKLIVNSLSEYSHP